MAPFLKLIWTSVWLFVIYFICTCIHIYICYTIPLMRVHQRVMAQFLKLIWTLLLVLVIYFICICIYTIQFPFLQWRREEEEIEALLAIAPMHIFRHHMYYYDINGRSPHSYRLRNLCHVTSHSPTFSKTPRQVQLQYINVMVRWTTRLITSDRPTTQILYPNTITF